MNVWSFLVVKLLVVLVSLDVNLSFHVINASVTFRLINMAYLELISKLGIVTIAVVELKFFNTFLKIGSELFVLFPKSPYFCTIKLACAILYAFRLL